MSGQRGSVMVAAGILCSRLTGLVREAVMAGYLGTSVAADAFRAAMRIPNLMQNLLGEGVLSAAFIPVYSRLLAEGRDDDAGKVAGAIAGLLAALTGVLVLVGVILAGPLTDVIAAGMSGERRDLTVRLVRILFPGVGFLVLSAWCLGVLNSHRRFFLSYVAPVIWNVAQITALAGAAWWLARGGEEPALATLATALAVGAAIGGVLQFAVQLPTVLALSRGLRLSLRRDLTGVRQAIGAFGPVLAGRGVVQLSAFLDTLLASFLAVGALSALGYAQALYLLPISLFGMSIAAAELPELSSMDRADRPALSKRVQRGLRQIAFLVTPVVVIYLVAGGAVVQALFQRGEFSADARTLVWLVLAGYAIGLPASTSSRLLQSALYGLDRPSIPARISAVRVLLSALIGVTLMFQLDRVAIAAGGLALVGDLPAFSPLPGEVAEGGGPLRLGAAGLSLAAGTTAWLEYGLLRRALSVRRVRPALGRWRVTRLATAAGVAVAAAAVAVRLVGDDRSFLAAAAIVLAAGVAYLAAAWLLRIPELRAPGRLAEDLATRDRG
ncbi:MAG: murein biosynthesis integral membrane protein MurJ [Euzebyales bacterium]|nr:murein biosynthesis integral membrane protein MurJ [Euzebyales bacterium]